jgi:hypothetical protein
MELEKSIAPRELYFIGCADGTSNTDDLKRFPGTLAIIRYVPDFEAERAARFVAYVLDRSGWKISGVEQTTDEIFDGVNVEPYHFTFPANSTPEEFERFRRDTGTTATAQKGSDAIADFLGDSNWVANPGLSTDIPPESVRISVGFKPNPYFKPKPSRDAAKIIENARNRMRPRRNTLCLNGSTESAMPWFPLPKKP